MTYLIVKANMETKYIKKCRKLISLHIYQMNKTISNVNKEWKQEQKEAKDLKLPVIYPMIYSNQYYAYVELIRFFKELKEVKDEE